MKKFIKLLGITLLSLLFVVYLAFLFVFPNVINLNKYMPDIKKMVAEQANLVLDVNNPKLFTTPFLTIGLSADKVSVKLPDGSELLKTDKSKFGISLPRLVFLTVKVTNAEIQSPSINIDIIDGKEYKIVKVLENINKEEAQDSVQTTQKPAFDINSIKIIIPKIKLTNYQLFINDLSTKNFLKLRGDELLLGYNNSKYASVKTNAELFVNNTKNINANIDIDTFIPQQEETSSTEVSEKEETPFINPVAVYMAYDLKTNIDSKIKIRQKDNQIISNGYFYIDNLTLNIGGMKLPESKLHLTTKGYEADLDSDIFVAENQRINLSGDLNYSKKPFINLNIKSDKINLNNIIRLSEAALNSANIPNDLKEYKGEGYFVADAKLKTDYSTLTSSGDITIFNCIVRTIKDNKMLTKVNSVLSLDNNMLRFVDTYVEILDAVLQVDGTIDQSSNADISVIMNKMPVEKLFNLFAPSDLAKTYSINTGDIDLNSKLKGKLQSLIADVKLSVKNLSVSDKVNNIIYFNNLLSADFNSDLKTFKGKINNSDFKMTMNGAVIDCEKFNLTVDDKNIKIEPSKIKINNSTVVSLSGEVKDYINNPDFMINADGNLITKDLKKLLGRDIAIYIKEKGSLPLKASVTGDSKMQTVKLSVEANKDNYITPIDITNVLNKNSILKAVIDLKGDSLKIKDTGLYIKNGDSLEEIASVDGNITKLDTKTPSINLIKLKMPNEINASLAIFPQSKLTAKTSVFVSGDLNQPKVKGDLNISNMTIPELFITMKNASTKFEGNDLDIDISNLVANGSDYDILINADLSPSQNFVIKNLILKSNLTDADKVTKVSDALSEYTTPAQSTQVSSNSNTSAASSSNIPVLIKDGSIDIKQIKTGNMLLRDTTSKISLSNNIFYLNNLVTNAFQGKISGNISTNLVSGEIKTDIKGTSLDVAQTLLDTSGMKDTLTGTMDFDAKISLKGSKYEEQVKALKGDVNFNMKDGSLGPFGRLETLVSADNLKSIAILSTVVGTVMKSTYDTSKFNTLKGHLTFNNGIAQINPITSAGDYMSTYIFGNFDVLNNTADMKLRGKLGSKVADSMGQLAMLNPVNAVKATSGMNIVLGQLLLKLCEPVTEAELAQIPTVSKETQAENTGKFQVVIRGNVAQPAKVVRSFKWLALDSEIKEAQSTLNSLGTVSIPTNIDDAKQQAKDIVKGLLSDGTKDSINQSKDAVNAVKSLLKNTTDTTDGTTSFKEQLKQTQKNTWQQLKEQAKQAVNEATITPSSERTESSSNQE